MKCDSKSNLNWDEMMMLTMIFFQIFYHFFLLTGVTPDRESALQQGMEALLRAVDGPSSGLHPPCPAQHRPCFPSAVHPDVPRLAITPRTPRGPTRRATPAHVAWDLPFVPPSVSEQKPQRPQTIQHRKGVLFPSSLQVRSSTKSFPSF